MSRTLSSPTPDRLPAGAYLPTPDPARFHSTPLARAGWPSGGQHGGVVAALLGRAIERVPTLAEMEVARLTVELFRVVGVVDLEVRTTVVREGKNIQLVDASLTDPEGVELARARGLRLRKAALEIPPDPDPAEPPLPHPDSLPSRLGQAWGVGGPEGVMFHRHGIDMRDLDDGFARPGGGAAWMRLVKGLVADEESSPLTRAVIVGDFINGLSAWASSHRYEFMNADLTIHLQRMPIGEWVGVRARSDWSSTGRGVATGTLYDLGGRIGHSSQTLFIRPA